MIRVGLSTTCLFPKPLETSFRWAAEIGYDAMEVMVTTDAKSRDADHLRSLSEQYDIPIMSIHAPVLFLTQFVWGRDDQTKLEKTAELAKAVDATSVVVHPPFRWQAGYARNFERIVRQTSERYDIQIAVENMFPWRVARRSLKAYAPSPDPTMLDVDAMTLDFSHASLTGRDSLELALAMGDKLRHIHLCDGSGSLDEGKVLDEHLVPGRGTEPVAEVLEYLARRGWDGEIAAEVAARKGKGEAGKRAALQETLDFARKHLAIGEALRAEDAAAGVPAGTVAPTRRPVVAAADAVPRTRRAKKPARR
jgi:sugar phosphate isomerase/epimerase